MTASETRSATPADLLPKRPRGRPRKTEGERDDGNRRQDLLAAAARLFRHQGFDATSTRDIAAAVGMHSGSPFYHFKSKSALLFAVVQEGMHAAMARQAQALQPAAHQGKTPDLTDQSDQSDLPDPPSAQMRRLIRAHFDTLLGPGNDFIPVMLYESRALTAAQRSALAQLQDDYEAAWTPVLQALHASGELQAPVKVSRLLILGALNWAVQWYDRQKGLSLDELTEAAMALFFARKR
jgi:AcrR family transcriptional regulator